MVTPIIMKKDNGIFAIRRVQYTEVCMALNAVQEMPSHVNYDYIIRQNH